MKARIACWGATFTLAGILGPSAAQGAGAPDYPTKPVRMIVVFPPGSGTDIAARLMAQELSAQLGKQFIAVSFRDVETWFGMLAPAKTPPAIIVRVHQEIAVALKKDQIRDKLTSQGYQTVGNTPAEFGRLIAREIDKWAKVVKMAGIKPIVGTN